MIKKFTILTLTLGLMATVSPVLAVPSRQVAQLSTPGTERVLVLPEAAGNSPVISLGSAVDPGTGQVVEGFAFIHYKKGFNHKDGHNKGGGKPGGGGDSSCFSFLARGAKWKVAEPWVVNTANSEGLASDFVFDNLTADIAKWESAAAADILGDGSVTTDVLAADMVSPDDVNEVYFGEISQPGAIAAPIVWGIFGGRPSNRQLVEWDMIFDEVDFDWSATGEAGKMDFENIMTHELGHAVGMGHPDSACAEETMYAFADFGETKKRDLNAGDIAGVAKLY